MIHKDSHLEIRLARTDDDLRAAQRLRYEVFVQELGGDGDQVDHKARLERDDFDPHCDHLLLIDTRRDEKYSGHVVGAYRMLTSEGAEKAGGFYSEGEYDLTVLRESGRSLLELGRSCVHRDYRGGMAMFHLWNGLATYVAEREIELLFGVASFHGTDADALAEPLTYLHRFHLAPPELKVRALSAHYQTMDLLPDKHIERARALRDTPALIKAYLRLGGYVGDGAFVDHEFNTTDVFLVMDTAKLSAKQRGFYSQGRLG